MSNLGDLLLSLRKEKSLNLREAARLSGLSHTYISDIEKGYRRNTNTPLNPSPETLKRLANAYNYSYDHLMEAAGYIEESEENESTPQSTKEEMEGKALFYDEENMTEEDWELVKQTYEALKKKRGKNE